VKRPRRRRHPLHRLDDYKEYRNYFEKDRALVRRFQKIDVNEPTIEDSIKICAAEALLRAASQFATPPTRSGAVELSHRSSATANCPTRRST